VSFLGNFALDGHFVALFSSKTQHSKIMADCCNSPTVLDGPLFPQTRQLKSSASFALLCYAARLFVFTVMV